MSAIGFLIRFERPIPFLTVFPSFWTKSVVNFVCFSSFFQYLLAMVLTYFKRAALPTSEYTRINLFTALYVLLVNAALVN